MLLSSNFRCRPSASTSKLPWPQSPRFQMKPSSRSIATRWSSPVTGFFSVVPWPPPTPGALEAAVHAVVVDLDVGADDPRDLVGGAEDRPRQAAELARVDLRQAAELLVADFGGHDEHRLAVAVMDRLRPIDDREGGDPRTGRRRRSGRSVTTLATAALQLPSDEVGKPEKLHVQPGWQLQNSYPRPLMLHCVFGLRCRFHPLFLRSGRSDRFRSAVPGLVGSSSR